jgi:hypothetical protein
VSRRSRRRDEAPGRERDAVREPGPGRDSAREARPKRPAGDAPDRAPAGPFTRLGAQLVLLAAVFGLGVLVAELFGAANLGVAFGVGQIAFAIAVVYLMLTR